MLKITNLVLTTLVFSLFSSVATTQQSSDEEELAFLYGDEEMVSIASGYLQPLTKAPSVATIITAKDIQESGARDLEEILEQVPGLHVSRSFFSYKPLYIFRGITSETNPQVLMLINGFPITIVQGGDRGGTWAGMPVEAIERIEVIRGPGSAVFGADAYAGMINIITKDYDTMKPQLIIGGGGFSTNELTLQGRADINGIKTAYSLELMKTDGHDSLIESDIQSYYDSLFMTSASLAPGKINTQKEMIEARLDFKFEDWQIRSGYQGRFNVGTGAGVSGALDPLGEQNATRFNFDINYQKQQGDFQNKLQFGFYDITEKLDLTILPAGFTLFIPGIDMPIVYQDGMIGEPDYFAKHYNLELSSFYTGLLNHKIRVGVGGRRDDLYKTRERKNFDSNGLPLYQLVDVSNDPNQIFAKTEKRDLFYLFAQDEWAIANDWDLTLGARYDSYSDFGDTFNPRIALVWQTDNNWTTKLLYGKAFRAPSFLELYNQNNPVTKGNDDLKPEILDSLEIALAYHQSNGLQWDINGFMYTMKDVIRYIPIVGSQLVESQNIGRQKGYGFETELKWQLNQSLTTTTNLARVINKDRDSNQEIAHIPKWQANIMSDWQISNDWLIHIEWQYIGKRKRSSQDIRNDLESYQQLHISAAYNNSHSPWEYQLGFRNLTNEIGKEPTHDGIALPNDLPIAGRQWLALVAFKF